MRRFGAYGSLGPAWGFTWDEVRSGDGVLPSSRYMRRSFRRQAIYLNRLRKKIRKAYGGKRVAISVTSWYRSPEYNARPEVGGSRYSQHVAGTATDIVVYVAGQRVPPHVVAQYARQIRAFERGGIGIYDSFTHLDHRKGGPARWRG